MILGKQFCTYVPLPNNNEDDPLMKFHDLPIDAIVYCCAIGYFFCCLPFLVYVSFLNLLCEIFHKQGQPLWLRSRATKSSSFHMGKHSSYKIEMYLVTLYALTALLPDLDSHEDDALMGLLQSDGEIGYVYFYGYLRLMYNLSCQAYDEYSKLGRPWWWPNWVNSSLVYVSGTFLCNEQMQSTHFTLQEPRKTQTNLLLFNPCISRIAGRTEIRSSVSNKVAEEYQFSSEGLKETFDSCSPRSFTLEELAVATNYFHQDRILGAGGFGAVYKAVLPNGQPAAVKRVSSTSDQGIKEYIAEVTIVSRSKHRHLVQLIGWCHEKKREFLLVYELLVNKSLDKHLFDPKMDSLPWSVRYKIAQGSAKALLYLHEECGQRCVLHRDFKSSNLLLDSNFEPKLSDFGLAKLVDDDKSVELSVIAGTKGYLDPECVFTGKVRTQSDVYSYGVVALELVTGRKPIIPHVAEDQQVLVEWVQNLYKARRVMKAVDPRLGDDYDKLQVKGLLIVGLWCVLHDFRKRPSMREIVRILNNAHDPLKDLHGKIPSLVPDPVSHDFDSIRPRTRRRFGCF